MKSAIILRAAKDLNDEIQVRTRFTRTRRTTNTERESERRKQALWNWIFVSISARVPALFAMDAAAGGAF
jgi:hypothetical protein